MKLNSKIWNTVATVEEVKRRFRGVVCRRGEIVVYEEDGRIKGRIYCDYCENLVELVLSGEVGVLTCKGCKERGCAYEESFAELNGGGLRVSKG